MLRTLEEKADPAHAALVVVDVQNDFCDDAGAFGRIGRDLAPVRAMVPRLARLVDQAREAGVPVVFLQYVQNPSTLSEVQLEQRQRGRAGVDYCQEGSWGADFYQITPKPDERVVPKHRYSGFVGTDLDLILRSTGRRALILTGVATNGCVESTARHGFMRDYYIVVVDDCCSCYSRAAHEATLSNITDAYGVVTTAGELGSIWAARSQPQA